MCRWNVSYKVGDSVIVNGHRGVISIVTPKYNGLNIYTVRFPDNVIPPTMEFTKSQLDRENSSTIKKCKCCGDIFKVTEHPVLGKKTLWYDCVKCGKTKEEIDAMEIEEAPPKINKSLWF